MENAEIARVLSEVADLLDLTGGSPFRIRAYRQVAQMVDLLPTPVSELWRKGQLTELPAIGTSMALHVEELLRTGTLREHERLQSMVPPGALDLLRIEGVGPKTAALAWKQLGVTGLDALEESCRDGRLEALPRMGARRVAAILKAIERHRARVGRLPLHWALTYAESLASRLRRVPGVSRVEVAGSIRRHKETVGDIDILAAAPDAGPVIRAFQDAAEVSRIVASGPTKCTVDLRMGLQADLRVLPPESVGAALHYFTGSKSHCIELRTRAVRLGVKLSEYGVFDREGRRMGGATEEEVFRAVGLPWIPPELREGAGEIEAAERGRLPALVEERDLVGDLHVHSRASSDARSDLHELADEASRLGRRYLAITDHSRSRPVGLDSARLREHVCRIREVSRSLGAHPSLLAGIEVDILPDGSLDLPLEQLAALDCVVASVHSRFSQPRAQMTERVVRAIRSGVVDVLGHPTGRLVGVRDPCELDLDTVFEAAREMGVAIEVNAMPDRLDLTDKGCRAAKEAGVRVAISSDAHMASHLGNLRYGVWVARRGWLEASDVVNTRSPPQLRSTRHRAGL